MTIDRRGRHRPFRNLRPPAAPAGLRERTLTAARAAAGPAEPIPRAGEEQPGRRRIADLLWESRPLRLAWAGALVCLIGVNLYLDRGPARAPEVRTAATSHRPAEAGPRTLLASREAVLEALLGDPPARRADPSTATRPRSTS